ncbi:MAG: HaeIII family restriction endonuclease [Gammaproteobacteria bacterium]|nr:HaeIII family restriction endonuclease [Gammaproteobacteria bacterium]
MPRPVESGKAWEYGLAVQFREILNSTLQLTSPRETAQEAYTRQSIAEQTRINKAANEVAVFLAYHDLRILDVETIEIQSDQKGELGDVRDILIHTPDADVGISAKNRHAAIKHSRLGKQLDFGQSWYGVPCSERYWAAVATIWDDLEGRKGELWRELPNKELWYYKPILDAFMDEITEYGIPELIMQYLLGRYSFYKVIKDNGTVKIQSFNFDKSLQWGTPIKLPSSIVHMECPMYRSQNRRRTNTVVMYLDEGWQVSFRLHNAESKIIPSLKFDVNLIGAPVTLSSHEIAFG